MKLTSRGLLGALAFLAISSIATLASAKTETLRIVNYNIEDDIGTFSGTNGIPRPGLIQPATTGGAYSGSTSDGGILEGIGEEALGASNNVQPLDILALEETTSNSLTVAPIVSAMNTYYGTPGMYAQSSVQGSQSGSTGFGNGPNAVVYNTKTLQLVGSVGVGSPGGSSNGEYRQVMRYEFAPAGATATAANEFYVYVSHYKSGGTSTDQTARQGEATIIRNDSATLPSTARVLYVGDYNIDSSSEASYQTIVGAGTNQGIDPLNTSGATGVDWSTSTTNTALLQAKTESATSLSSRDDLQIMTSNVYNATAGGLKLIPNTYHGFGNNGTTPYHSSSNITGNTALNSVVADGGTFISASQLKIDLTQASDHLPVVADYSIDYAGTCTWVGGGGSGLWSVGANWDSTPTNGDNLVFAGTSQLSTSNTLLSSAGSITFSSGAGAFSLGGNSLTITGGITNNSTTTQTVSLNLALSGAQSFNAASGALVVNGNVDNGGTALTVMGSSNTTLGGTVSGAGALIKTGSGTVILSGNNTYSGGTTVTGGQVQMGSNTGLGSSTAALQLNTGTTLDLRGFNPTIGALNGSGSGIQSGVAGPASLTVGNGGGSGTFSGSIVNSLGTVGLVKTGAGTQILSGTDTYAGGTTVNGGTLQVGSTTALGNTQNTLTVNSGTLDMHGFNVTTGAINGTGGAIQSNTAAVVRLTAGNGGGTGSYAGTIGIGSGTLSLTKTGGGSQTLSGNNSYTGGTTVNNGTLVVGNVHALGTGGLSIISGATTTLQSGLSSAVVLPSLAIDAGSAAPTSTLDITNNKLVLSNANATAANTTHTTVTNQVLHAFDNFAWDQGGITSSTAQNDINNNNLLTGVGIMLNNDGGGGNLYQELNGTSTFGGQTTDANSVLVRYTYLGDLNLDGVVDANDFNLFSIGYSGGAPQADWAWGDLDYNGTIDGSDYNLFALGYASNVGLPTITEGAGGVQPVPEPGTLLLAALGLIGIAGMQTRKLRRKNSIA